jgi:hypothetical protein
MLIACDMEGAMYPSMRRQQALLLPVDPYSRLEYLEHETNQAACTVALVVAPAAMLETALELCPLAAAHCYICLLTSARCLEDLQQQATMPMGVMPLKGKEGNSGGARKAGYTAMLCTTSINLVHNNVIQYLRADYPAVEAPRTVIRTASVHR